MLFQYINRNPEICRGSPVINGRRLTICNIILSCATSLESCKKDYELSLDTIKEAIIFCKDLHCFSQSDSSRTLNFCCNCILRNYTEPDEFEVGVFYDNLNKANSLEHKNELIHDYIGYRTWKIADLLFKHIFIENNHETNFNIAEID
ncbi:MAG TPA: DUF433 domain-containing protein [Chitinophagales bacterium]|nr:DUF433 domain-containing protein [Chitinophagales bacterium]HNL84061.1 DUF433 domain-containing protein [Chitinophagales bacterium]